MTGTEIKKIIVNDLKNMPQKNLVEVYDFIEFVKLREDRWFIDYVNRRTKAAFEAKRKGKRFYSLKEIQKICPSS